MAARGVNVPAAAVTGRGVAEQPDAAPRGGVRLFAEMCASRGPERVGCRRAEPGKSVAASGSAGLGPHALFDLFEYPYQAVVIHGAAAAP